MDLEIFKNLNNENNLDNNNDFLQELENFMKNNISEIPEENVENSAINEENPEEIENNENLENVTIDDERLDYRKEGHLYLVTEDRNDKIYLWDYTDKAENEIEEELSEDLKGIATEGAMLKYENGKYILYSPYGYDIVENEEE